MPGGRPEITLRIENFLNACADWCEDHWVGGIALRVVIVLAYFVLRIQDIGRIAFWTILLLAALFVPRLLMWLRERETNRRFLNGQCIECGYDLRASPQRCPECGTEVPRGFSNRELPHRDVPVVEEFPRIELHRGFSHKGPQLPYDPHKT
ncbi:MAG TPA: hypothetical protein VH370_25355 [Humisphaera sp.]|jgi:hypothetical protein|nr:hypothetical protein [Humisphaera sp.]